MVLILHALPVFFLVHQHRFCVLNSDNVQLLGMQPTEPPDRKPMGPTERLPLCQLE